MKRNKVIFIVIALVGIFVAALLVRQNQELRRLAEEPAKVAQIAISSEKLEGNMARVNVMFRTGPEGGKAYEIGAMSFRLVYALTDEGRASVVDENGYAISKIFPNEELDLEKWQFPVNKVVVDKDVIKIDFVGVHVDEKGYATSESERVAHFYMKFEDEDFDDLFNLRLDENLSAMMTKKEPVKNVLNISEGGLLSIEFAN